MRDHWQQNPVVIRDALPDARSMFVPDDIVALAARDDVESRLVTRRRGRRYLAHGPFEPGDLPGSDDVSWTLLVQGVDLHLQRARALLDRFRFVPDVRLDDLMLSVAGDRGGVGPHVDAYDVFLLQIRGKREWRLAPPGNWRLRTGEPLKVIEGFRAAQTHLLGPGDMLYLPPDWAHDGIARGNCMTASIGFRSPSRTEAIASFLVASADLLAASAGETDSRYRDTGQRASAHPGRIPDQVHATMRRWISDWRPSAHAIRQFVGAYLTEPKPQVWFDKPRRALPIGRFRALAAARGIELDRRTRTAYDRGNFYINGDALAIARPALVHFAELADGRAMDAPGVTRALTEPRFETFVYACYRAGWLHVRGTRSAQARDQL